MAVQSLKRIKAKLDGLNNHKVSIPFGFAIIDTVDLEQLRDATLLKAKRVAGANADVEANMILNRQLFISFCYWYCDG